MIQPLRDIFDRDIFPGGVDFVPRFHTIALGVVGPIPANGPFVVLITCPFTKVRPDTFLMAWAAHTPQMTIPAGGGVQQTIATRWAIDGIFLASGEGTMTFRNDIAAGPGPSNVSAVGMSPIMPKQGGVTVGAHSVSLEWLFGSGDPTMTASNESPSIVVCETL